MGSFNTVNPYNNEVIKEYSLMTKEELNVIKNKVNDQQKKWKDLSLNERSSYFNKLAQVLRKNKRKYAEIMTNEMGKAIKESLAEVEKCAWLSETLAENAEEWLKEETINADGKKHIVVFEPLGVILLIMPWNFPFWQAMKVGLPPLLAGNGIILKHAKNVTGSSLAIEEAIREAGFPEDIFRSIYTGHQEVAELIDDDIIQGVSLTGSTSVGANIAERAGRNVKKLVLELGGSDPFIILEDADLDQAAELATLGRMYNSGQVCIAAKRIIVVEKVAKQFTQKYLEKVQKLKLGNPLDESTDIGPMVNKKALKEMKQFVDDAVEKGGKVLIGGKIVNEMSEEDENGSYFTPTILIDTNTSMDAVCNEVFGPIAPIVVVKDEEEAIRIANDTEYGLSAGICTKDSERGERLARKINAGSVFINNFPKSHPLIPLGGIKKSGYGRELSSLGVKEFVNIKPINFYD